MSGENGQKKVIQIVFPEEQDDQIMSAEDIQDLISRAERTRPELVKPVIDALRMCLSELEKMENR